jgi:heat shock protein HslJ
VRRTLMTIAIATIGFTAAACSASGGTGGTLDGTAWTLKTYTVSGTATPVPAGMVVDAKFADGKVSGFAGCNLYSASATISGSTLKIGTAATTMKACDPAITGVESAYLANLAKAATFTATADALTIFDSAGKELLAYTAASANPLEGEWNVTGYNTGTQAVTSPIAGTTLTATFTPDGQVAGDAGCNTYNGPYKLDGTSLTVGPLATTFKACEQAIMDQEAQFLKALQTPTTVETSGPTVTLRDSSGATQVVLSPK